MDREDLLALAQIIAEAEGLDLFEFIEKIAGLIDRGELTEPSQILSYARGGSIAPSTEPPPSAEPPSYVFPLPNFTGTVQPHGGSDPGGSDIFAPRGTSVYSVGNGTVVNAGFSRIGGNFVLVKGNDGRQYYYAHMLYTPKVRSGQTVESGQIIGQVGNTGNAEQTQPHLHFGAGDTISEGVGAKGGVGTNFDAVSWLKGLPRQDVPMGPASAPDTQLSLTDVPPPVERINKPNFSTGRSLEDLYRNAAPFTMSPVQAEYYFPFAGTTSGAGAGFARRNILTGMGIHPSTGYGKFLQGLMPAAETRSAAESMFHDVPSENSNLFIANSMLESLRSGNVAAPTSNDFLAQLRDLATRRMSGETLPDTQESYLTAMEDPKNALPAAANLLRYRTSPMTRSYLEEVMRDRYEQYLRRQTEDPNQSLFAYLLSR